MSPKEKQSHADSSEPEQTTGTRTRLRDLPRMLGQFFLELSIPLALALVIYYLTIRLFRLERLNTYLLLVLYAIVVPVMALLFSVLLQKLSEWLREPVSERKAKKPVPRWRRYLRILVSGLLVPILVSWLASIIPVSQDETLLTMLLSLMRREYSFIRTIGDTVISSSSYETKTEGVNTLEIIHSDPSLDELFRILEEDTRSLENWAVYDAMVSSMASYETEAHERLIQLFLDRVTHSTPAVHKPDLYSSYFEIPFERLRTQLETEVLDVEIRERQLLALDQLDVQVRSTLAEIAEESQPVWAERGDLVLDFVLDTFLRMEQLGDDEELYFLAKNVAADPTFAEGTRCKALLLVARLGSESDFDLLVSYLHSDREPIKAAALRAIGILHKRVTGQRQTEETEVLVR